MDMSRFQTKNDPTLAVIVDDSATVDRCKEHHYRSGLTLIAWLNLTLDGRFILSEKVTTTTYGFMNRKGADAVFYRTEDLGTEVTKAQKAFQQLYSSWPQRPAASRSFHDWTELPDDLTSLIGKIAQIVDQRDKVRRLGVLNPA